MTVLFTIVLIGIFPLAWYYKRADSHVKEAIKETAFIIFGAVWLSALFFFLMALAIKSSH